jgi:uncharacterized protein YjiS (DUF1127 family)
MSAPISKTQFTFELPNLSYVDASLEEPSLRSARETEVHPAGFGDWLARRIAAIVAWRRQQVALGELAMMTDHELADIGLNRGDLHRVFDAKYNRDLLERGAAC